VQFRRKFDTQGTRLLNADSLSPLNKIHACRLEPLVDAELASEKDALNGV
jgi:hypothetical protein